MKNKISAKAPKVHFITMGCAKNEVDTREMKDKLLSAGIMCTKDLDACDIVVVNTCSFIQAAIEESIDAILDVVNDDRIIAENIPVIVAGCMPSRYGEELSKEIHEAADFVPCSKEDDIVSIVCECLHIDHDSLTTNANTSEATPEAGFGETFAYVKISDGCDRFCSYCTIPYIRGRYHSFPESQIIDNVKRLFSAGFKEIVLIGQDTGLWGSDLDGELDLSVLLDHLADKFPELLFRTMYTQPENVTDRLLKTIYDHENIASYLDIPFQHCSSSLLKAMNRNGSAKEFLYLIEKARETVPGIAIRTTLMVGFPGESEEDFDELIEFVEEAKLEYVGIFSYSQEEGTKAASMPDQIDQAEKDRRYSILRDVSDSISNLVLSNRIGSVQKVLVEGFDEDGQLFGRTTLQAPEVDGITFIDSGKVHNTYDAKIVDTLFYDMEAEAI